MKAYAVSSRFCEDHCIHLQYGAVPAAEFRYTTRERAAVDCFRLNRINVHAGSHCCAFVVEQLPEGDFGIICACHPLSVLAGTSTKLVSNLCPGPSGSPERLVSSLQAESRCPMSSSRMVFGQMQPELITKTSNCLAWIPDVFAMLRHLCATRRTSG